MIIIITITITMIIIIIIIIITTANITYVANKIVGKRYITFPQQVLQNNTCKGHFIFLFLSVIRSLQLRLRTSRTQAHQSVFLGLPVFHLLLPVFASKDWALHQIAPSSNRHSRSTSSYVTHYLSTHAAVAQNAAVLTTYGARNSAKKIVVILLDGISDAQIHDYEVTCTNRCS